MAIYVDTLLSYKSGRWCHMMADSLDELHEFAEQLGLKRAWFQKPPKASAPHYDLRASKRELAVELGAIEITSREENCKRIAWMAHLWEQIDPEYKHPFGRIIGTYTNFTVIDDEDEP
jgi:hypothetical protein